MPPFSNLATAILLTDPIIVLAQKTVWRPHVIMADGQLEAFEGNIFLHFLLSNFEEFVAECRVSCCRTAQLGKRCLLSYRWTLVTL